MSKIAKVDNEAMNSLYASELTKAGVKFAADDDGKGTIHAPQAWEDHQEYLATLKSIMSEGVNGRASGNENDVLQD